MRTYMWNSYIFLGKILKHRHHTERESIDNTNNYCFFVYADIPVLLLIYSHFTIYELFIHTKLIIVFWCRHILCWAFIYSHFTSPKKVKKKCIPAHHQTSLIFCWVFCFCRFPNFKTVLWHVTKWKFTNLFTVTKQKHLHSYTSQCSCWKNSF